VLFSDEAEAVYQRDGLEAFTRHEITNVLQPLPPGPFKPLLEALHRLQNEKNTPVKIRTALVTARSAPAHERAVFTLRQWNIAIDEAMFLGGLDKGAFLKSFEPDFYFDDQRGHIDSARLHVAAGHVPFGVRNLR
jgi:5'-nucleotidase